MDNAQKLQQVSKIARSPHWTQVAEAKEWDTTSTSILRVYANSDGLFLGFGRRSLNGRDTHVETVMAADRAVAANSVATACGFSPEMVAKALS